MNGGAVSNVTEIWATLLNEEETVKHIQLMFGTGMETNLQDYFARAILLLSGRSLKLTLVFIPSFASSRARFLRWSVTMKPDKTAKKSKPKRSDGNDSNENMGEFRRRRPDPEVEADERFKGIRRDPRFRPFRTEERKVKVDDRFKAMLVDPKFNLTHKVDPRGRPSKVKSSAENMRKFYSLEDEEEKKTKGGDESSSESDSDEGDSEEVDKEAPPDYARGEAPLQSSSSEVRLHQFA